MADNERGTALAMASCGGRAKCFGRFPVRAVVHPRARSLFERWCALRGGGGDLRCKARNPGGAGILMLDNDSGRGWVREWVTPQVGNRRLVMDVAGGAHRDCDGVAAWPRCPSSHWDALAAHVTWAMSYVPSQKSEIHENERWLAPFGGRCSCMVGMRRDEGMWECGNVGMRK
jgi:hypothetical protein